MISIFKKTSLLLVFFLFTINIFAQKSTRLYDIAKNIEIYTNIYKELNKNFVDEIDPGILMKTGVDAMTRSLDPYTKYYSESAAESFRISTQGKYSGIGAIMKNIDSVITVIELYKDSPSYKAGLKIGDQIVEVSGKSTFGKSSKDVASIVRGAPGTEIKFTVQSYGENSTKSVIIVRGEIDIPNVPYYGMVNDSIGYIHLSTFTKDAGTNVRNALKSLKDSVELKGIILDLRGNGGGLLKEAIEVTNVFVRKDEELVSTRGKIEEKNREYKTYQNAYDENIPLVVLINNRSASASEIVSGSIQDLDRGVLIGQRSFGKGLVQNIFPIGFNSKVKITISKYYIPSGRCIQSKIYDKGKVVKIEKDKRNVFHTKNGREVYDVGGVMPDIKIEKEKYSTFVESLLKDNVIFRYVNAYRQKHDSIVAVEDFNFDEFEDFKDFFNKYDFTYKTKTEKSIENLKKTIIEDEMDSELEKSLDELLIKIRESKKSDIDKAKDQIMRLIEREIVKRYYFKRGMIKDSLKNDKEVKSAIEVLSNLEEYQNILNPVK
jgi:carboxyl-terminal processing protease